MLITDKVLIKKRGNKNLKYYRNLGYNTDSDFEIDVKDLTKSSKILVEIKCDFCGKIVKRPYYLYLKNIESNNLFACSSKCGVNKTIMTNLSNIGVEYVNQSKEIKQKTIKTNLEKYGVEYPIQNNDIKEKSKKTNLEKYGVEYTLQSSIVRDKIKKTNLEKYGVDHNFKSSFVKEKKKKTYLEKYGVDNPSKSDIIKDKKKETCLENWGVDNPSKSDIIKKKKKETCLENWGVEYPMQSNYIINKSKKTLLDRYNVTHNMMIDNVKNNMKLNNIKKYGVEYTLQIKEVKEKIKQTNIEKYGGYTYQSEELYKKVKNTNLEKYGVEYPMKLDYIKEKVMNTNLEKYGVEYPMKLYYIQEKAKNTNLEKWGVDNYSKTEEYKTRINNTNLEKYNVNNIMKNELFRKNFLICQDNNYIKYLENSISIFKCDCGKEHEFEINITNYHDRKNHNIPLCTICNPISDSKSIKEKELYKIINSIYSGEIIQSYRDGLEIDIYLPELKIGFEFNGLYWHSEEWKEKNYHLSKTNYFKERGIKIIHIWEDDWDLRKDILKSQIQNWLKLTDNKIYARKCIIKEIKNSSKFLNDNHIQGKDNSNIKLGLFYEGELISLMTFNKTEGRKMMLENEWNLSRFCNKLNTNVIGGASKLFKYFTSIYKPTRIVSYADKDWSSGDLYYNLNFNLVYETKPDYKYIINGKRIHKSRYRKSKLNTELTESQHMKKSHIFKIWDCGKMKFEFK